MFKNMFQFVAVIAVLAATALAGCGSATTSASQSVGPSPLTRSGYRFTLTVPTNTISVGGTIIITVRVTDANGAPKAGVPVYVAGDATFSAISGTSTADGTVVIQITTSAGAGFTGFITAMVEETPLSVPYFIRP